MKQILTSFSVILLFLISHQTKAQQDSIWLQNPKLTISGFVDIFYVYDLSQAQRIRRQDFLYNHNRHNEFNLNLGLVKFNLNQEKYRANFAVQTGTYANDNYVAEPGLLKNIFEANIGISLNKKNNLWLDAGVLPSHIGFESAISMDNMTLTRSLLAENSPYFLAGAKLSYAPNNKWEFAGLMVNGWQRIQRLVGNSLPSFGTQINFKPSANTTLNWSTFVGTDEPDNRRTMRYFNNFFGQFKLNQKLNLIAGLDIGFQQKSKGSSAYDFWLSPVLIAQLTINENWKTAMRAEYYRDETGVIVPTSTINGFQTTGVSLNFDYSPTPALVCRIEGRWFNSMDKIFESNSRPNNDNVFIGTSIALKFSELIN